MAEENLVISDPLIFGELTDMASFQPMEIVDPGSGSGGGTILVFTNRVWDTQAGPAFVRWDTNATADPTGANYPGPGTFGVHTSDFCVEYVE